MSNPKSSEKKAVIASVIISVATAAFITWCLHIALGDHIARISFIWGKSVACERGLDSSI